MRFKVATEPLKWWQAVLLACVTTGAGWAVRLAFGAVLESEAPYVVFLAAVLVSALWGGLLAGMVAAFLGAVTANLSFVGPSGEFVFDAAQVAALLFFLVVAGFITLVGSTAADLLRRERHLNARLAVVSRELEHRVKNILAVTQGIVHQAARSSTSADEVERKVAERLHALAAAQSLLTQSAGRPIHLRRLLEDVLGPFGLEGRFVLPVERRTIMVPPELAASLSMLLYELATNSVKHGALSSDRGRVALDWCEHEAKASLRWQERDGPAVVPPRTRGLGTRLMEAAIPQGLGSVSLAYDPGGVRCLISFECPPLLCGSDAG